MADAVDLILLMGLGVNIWHLNEIRKLLEACHLELNTARWERGRLLRAQQNSQAFSSVSREAEDAVI
jgi:hypothetical protein